MSACPGGAPNRRRQGPGRPPAPAVQRRPALPHGRHAWQAVLPGKCIAAAVALLLAEAPAAAQSFGDFQLARPSGGDGGVSEQAPSPGFSLAFTLRGNDAGGRDRITRFQTEALTNTEVAFTWSFSTEDQSAFWDPAGFSVSGSDTRITDDSLRDQSGSGVFIVDAGELFGWWVGSRDGAFGPGFLTVNASFSEIIGPVLFDFGDIVQVSPGSGEVNIVGEARTDIALSRPGESSGIEAIGAEASVRIWKEDPRPGLALTAGFDETFAVGIAGASPGSNAGVIGAVVQDKINVSSVVIRSSILDGVDLGATGTGASIAAAGAHAVFAVQNAGTVPGGGVVVASITQSAHSAGNVGNEGRVHLGAGVPVAASVAVSALGAGVGTGLSALPR